MDLVCWIYISSLFFVSILWINFFVFFFVCFLRNRWDKETAETHRNWNPIETNWFPITLVSFGWELHKLRISILIGQRLENRPNQTDSIPKIEQKTMKMVAMGTIWTLIALWHVTIFSNSLDGRDFLPKTWPQGCNAITTYFIFFPYFLGNVFKLFFFFSVSLSSSSLSILQPILHPHAQKIKEREREKYLAQNLSQIVFF